MKIQSSFITIKPLIGGLVTDCANDMVRLSDLLGIMVECETNGKTLRAVPGDNVGNVLADFYPPTVHSPSCVNLRLTPKNHYYGNWICERIDGKWRSWNSMGGRREMCGHPVDWDTNWTIERIK